MLPSVKALLALALLVSAVSAGSDAVSPLEDLFPTPAVRSTPSGTYSGSVKVLGISVHASITVKDTSHSSISISGPVTISCNSEKYSWSAGSSKVSLPDAATSGDCLHDALKKNSAKLNSVTYDSSSDSITLKVHKVVAVTVKLTKGGAANLVEYAESASILRTDVPISLTSGSFVKFADIFNKYYATEAEATEGLTNFMTAAKFVNEQNARYAAGNSTWFAGLNEFHDLSEAEQLRRLTGYSNDGSFEINTPPVEEDANSPVYGADWTHRLSSIQHQGCGDCWAFGSGAALEFKCGPGSVNEAEIRDCSGAGSCQGGNPVRALKWACKNGVESRKQYPVDNESKRDAKCAAHGGSCKCSGVKTSSGSSTLKQWVSRGVVSIGVAAGGGFMSYRGGLFTGSCGSRINHSVSIVAFDGTNFKLRNQWGTSWGAGGYMTLRAGSNQCQFEKELSMPN